MSFQDPFADEVKDTPVVEEKTSNKTAAKVSLKGTWEAPWVTIDTEIDFNNGEEFTVLAEKVVKANLYLAKKWDEVGRPHAPKATVAEETRRSAPQGDKAPSQPSGVMCNHGERVRRSGVSAKGPWTALFCPAAKGDPDQCSPMFLDKNGNPRS